MSYGFNHANLPHSPEAAIIWAREQGLLRQNANCNRHRRQMILYTESETSLGGRFRCPVGRTKCNLLRPKDPSLSTFICRSTKQSGCCTALRGMLHTKIRHMNSVI